MTSWKVIAQVSGDIEAVSGQAAQDRPGADERIVWEGLAADKDEVLQSAEKADPRVDLEWMRICYERDLNIRQDLTYPLAVPRFPEPKVKRFAARYSCTIAAWVYLCHKYRERCERGALACFIRERAMRGEVESFCAPLRQVAPGWRWLGGHVSC